ncbi:hypothetical protein FRC03_011212 [Tulasnella sp. 419]|nr:hypothetical protein FRC02_011158 [Tulasnella sp. 418]KAG8955299.1 hypothetical protein FRC03_011212 [Tulasnella sp. 419]
MLRIASRRLNNVLRSTGVRAYSDSRLAGSTAQSREFSKKEKAHEDQYVRQKEAADLEKLRKKLAEHQKELDKLTKQVEEHVSKK